MVLDDIRWCWMILYCNCIVIILLLEERERVGGAEKKKEEEEEGEIEEEIYIVNSRFCIIHSFHIKPSSCDYYSVLFCSVLIHLLFID